MARVQLNDVVKQYSDVTAVDNMNLDINDGEFVTLVGPSGCGKSTTMETIAGLTKPTSGQVLIGDTDVTNYPPKDRGVAMVFQNIALFPHMDVYDNISFGLRLRDFDKEEIDRRVEHAASVVQLEGMLDRQPDEMSGGQRQRVAIARAIVRNPAVFLMDEPLANLDAKLRVHMRTELQRLHKELDTTIIYVTHDQAEAMTMSDRIAVINDGKLQQIDPPLVCYNEPENLFVAGFIGSPSMNFIEGEVTSGGFTSEYINVSFDPADFGVEPGDQVTLGVRPEDVYREEDERKVTDPTSPVQTMTDVLEPMGNEIFVYLTYGSEATSGMQEEGDDRLLMSVDPDTEIDEDQDQSVVLDRSRLHLFDTASGEAIVHGLSQAVEKEARTGD
ncbi:ABC transporter ATP-binding protein [Haloarchaeobius amylolyticus]|uniref:ABC transporter ATP-binding protein n=1 Tax=Haloarchaeobius amylolyticus TaxID=1198296 RepID=UPI0022705BBB|nr:ABC transporter ATP-binding protein [Haloarchaeobius amylolyticus]